LTRSHPKAARAVATAKHCEIAFSVSKAEKRIVIYGKRRVFDGFFKIDETELSYERFDRKMSPPVNAFASSGETRLQRSCST